MIVYSQAEIPFRDLRPDVDAALAIRRSIAFLRREFSLRHPEHRTAPYIVAQRRNIDRQVLEIRMCAPANETLDQIARAGDTSWDIEQFIETS